MSEIPEKSDSAENPQDGYPVAPLPPAKKISPQIALRISPKVYSNEPSPEKPFQYTLADMFALTTAVAVFMSIVTMFPLPTVAGATGVGAFISLILLTVWPPEQQLLRLGWWVLFVLYLMTCIGAIIFGR